MTAPSYEVLPRGTLMVCCSLCGAAIPMVRGDAQPLHIQYHADIAALGLELQQELAQTRDELSEADGSAQGLKEKAAAAQRVAEAANVYANRYRILESSAGLALTAALEQWRHLQ